MYEGIFVTVTALANAALVAFFLRYYVRVVWVFALSAGAINGIIMFLIFVAQKLGMPMVFGFVIAFFSPRPALWLAHQVLQGRRD